MLAILAIIGVSNCTRIPDNNDPVLGIWSRTTTATEDAKNQNVVEREEWIFNDVYLGRYHRYSDNAIVLQTDFSWEVTDDGTYSINYGVQELPPVEVSMTRSEENDLLELPSGEVFATRQ